MRKYYTLSSTTAWAGQRTKLHKSCTPMATATQQLEDSPQPLKHKPWAQSSLLGKARQATTSTLWGLLTLLSLLLSACQSELLETPILSVEPHTELLLPASGEAAHVVVHTNQSSWSAVSSDTWLKLRQAGNNLIIEAEGNTTIEERRAQIAIIAGAKQVQLSITQQVDKQTAITLDPSESLTTDRLSKEYRVLVKTSSDKWRVRHEASESPWLNVLARPRYGELILSFEENKTRATRTARLVVEDGDASSELIVHQQGIPHFFLPHLAWESDLDEAEAFEVQRNSRITLRPRAADPLQGIRAIPYFQFSTISSAFQQVRYEYLNMGPRFLYKATLVAQDLSVTKGSELTDFLHHEGYQLRTDLKSSELSKFYVHETKKIHLQYTIDNDAKEAYLIFTPLVEQTQEYAVPQNLPLGFPIKTGSTKAEVEDWEKQMKGEHSDGISQALGLPAFFSAEPHFLRYYLYQENDANALQAVFVTLDPKYQGLYRYGGLLFVGREFDRLIQSEGFVYDSYDQRAGTHFYTHEQRNLRLAVSLMRMANLELTRVQVTLLK
ncbi:MAG: BACON domain-containing carbohydrate-binding protein [Porphyromonadaceae bacterium]|nr:BACON domain-containing carbohydrate-binding protein [Porphyromonadaceae bacterium]